MSTKIEPNNDQKQAALDFYLSDYPDAWQQDWAAGHDVPPLASNDEEGRAIVELAQLFADREAALRAQVEAMEKHLTAARNEGERLTKEQFEAMAREAHLCAEVALLRSALKFVDDDASADPGVRDEARTALAKTAHREVMKVRTRIVARDLDGTETVLFDSEVKPC